MARRQINESAGAKKKVTRLFCHQEELTLTEEDIAFLHCIGITIGYNNYPEPDKFPGQQEQQQGDGEEGIEVCK